MPVTVLRVGGAILVEKRLSPREAPLPEARAGVASEASLLRVLGGRVTPRLVEAGEDARGPFLRTAAVPFPTLAERLGRAADAAFVEQAVRSAFLALAALHEAEDDEGPLDVVHADLSPANVALADDGSACFLLDLGLSLHRRSPPRDGAFRGTALYVAPEVARGERPTPRSDLFSLAATLLHVATGEPPRRIAGAGAGAAPLAALIAEAAETPVLDARRASLAARGPGHAAVIACLAHDPADRPASAREVLSRLHRLR
jgi:serine/threonine protein kinase